MHACCSGAYAAVANPAGLQGHLVLQPFSFAHVSKGDHNLPRTCAGHIHAASPYALSRVMTNWSWVWGKGDKATAEEVFCPA
eukprot:605295-Pelagomonas_calceolata.AAC.1